MGATGKGRASRVRVALGVAGLAGAAVLGAAVLAQSATPRVVSTPMVVFGTNDLGMHCMQQDFSQMMILPPYNNLHAMVVDRTHGSPEIVTSGVTVEYTIPSNTHASDKVNFWRYAQALLGVALPPEVGLTGNRMSGVMTPTGNGDWAATGIPVVPIDDNGRENPYPLATITVKRQGAVVAQTQAVVPASWEQNCNLCHHTAGISVATDILRAHDRLHGTTLEQQQPVNCSSCHSDNALGAPGLPGVSSLSMAMHGAHAPRMNMVNLAVDCYACHPGIRTQCQRDVHFVNGMNCHDCHTSMEAVANPARRPWIDEPKCADCHSRPGFQFEEAGKLFRESRGHNGITCLACHGSPHAITPTAAAVDNLQALNIQGHSGVINTCTVCHQQTPGDPFNHTRHAD